MADEVNLSASVQDLVPLDTQQQLANSKELIFMIDDCVARLKEIAENMVIKSTVYATDMLQMGRQFRYSVDLQS